MAAVYIPGSFVQKCLNLDRRCGFTSVQIAEKAVLTRGLLLLVALCGTTSPCC
jgi:hypothetical protein